MNYKESPKWKRKNKSERVESLSYLPSENLNGDFKSKHLIFISWKATEVACWECF